ncbi:aminopeptidase P family protein (plasmid) [Planococcus glaciei]|uniref:Aminopeptidase P family protein n=1 Tax=Planococcus glaciei TaxID=459472 RepID=A0A7H8QG64_9BACL|nr:Xaa-Pro peptidase family protein [Planococcus glaciei]QKX52879.1 aminopeptidase P family protein [Planococcus glaciei]
MFEARKKKLVQVLKKNEIGAIVLVPGPNLYYFTGLKLKQSERLTLAVITQEAETFFVSPQVELSKVEETVNDDIFWYTDEEGPSGALSQLKKAVGTLGIIGVEYDQMRVMELKAVEAFEAAVVDGNGLINNLRICKDEQEIEQLQQAVNILESSFEAVLPYIKPGVTEVEIAAQLEFEMRKRGSEGTPFGTIVASGDRGASPHGRASEKKIRSGELVVMDFGAIVNGYVGDICRTVAIGTVSTELKEIYEIVQLAQQTALDSVKPGVTAHEVDQAAREVIESHGYGEYFTHRTGHGLGLNSHEMPYLMKNNEMVLLPGMAFSVEPGIYLPDKVGVRIEDNLIITEDGFINLMSLPKELLTV